MPAAATICVRFVRITWLVNVARSIPCREQVIVLETQKGFSMRRSLSFAVVLLLSTRLLAAGAVVVTNVNDSGPGSLRQAILDLPRCSRPCLLGFDIAGTPPAGYWTI